MEGVRLSYDAQHLAQKLKVVVGSNHQLIPQIIQELQQNADRYAQVREYTKLVRDFESLIHNNLAQQTKDPVVNWITQLKFSTQADYPTWEKNNFGSGLNVRSIFYAYLKCLGVCDVLTMENYIRERHYIIKHETDVVHNTADLDSTTQKKLDRTVSIEEMNSKNFTTMQETLSSIREDLNKQAGVSEQRWHEIPTAIQMVTRAIESLTTKDRLIFSESKLKDLINALKDSESKKKITAVKKQRDEALQENKKLMQKNASLEKENSLMSHNFNVMKKEKERQAEELATLKTELANSARELENLKSQFKALQKEKQIQQEKAKLMQQIPPKFIIHYKMSDKFIMADEIIRCFTELQTKSNYEFKPFDQDNLKSCQLLINFELVDDRIREVEAKQAMAQSLLGMTRNNCVWAFICFKPTENQEATKITNSVQNLTSGYTTKEGNFVHFYLTSEYMIDASKNDKAGNLLHYLNNKDKFKEQILALLDRKKPALTSVTPATPVTLSTPEPDPRDVEPAVRYNQTTTLVENYVSSMPSEACQKVLISKGATTLQLSIADDQMVLATVLIQPTTGSVHVQPSNAGSHVRTGSVGGIEKSLRVSSTLGVPINVESNTKPLEASDRVSEGFVMLGASNLPQEAKELVAETVQVKSQSSVSLPLDEIPETLLELNRVLCRENSEFIGKRIQVEAQEGPNWIKLESDSQVRALQSGFLPHVQFRVQIQ